MAHLKKGKALTIFDCFRLFDYDTKNVTIVSIDEKDIYQLKTNSWKEFNRILLLPMVHEMSLKSIENSWRYSLDKKRNKIEYEYIFQFYCLMEINKGLVTSEFPIQGRG